MLSKKLPVKALVSIVSEKNKKINSYCKIKGRNPRNKPGFRPVTGQIKMFYSMFCTTSSKLGTAEVPEYETGNLV